MPGLITEHDQPRRGYEQVRLLAATEYDYPMPEGLQSPLRNGSGRM